MDLVREVQQFCEYHDLLHRGDTIVLGCSGGPDSLALLDVLSRLRKDYKLTLIVVYIHHGLRRAADEEMAHVAAEAEKRHCLYIRKKIDIPALAQQAHISLETAGRQARYSAFQAVAHQYQAQAIAVAHHQNDQAETVLMHLLRGSGIHGLGGMRPKTGMIIRPFLGIRRMDIERYIRENNLSPSYDETNDKPVFLRNALRLEVIPFLQRYNPSLVDDLNRLALIAQGDDELLEEEACTAYVNHHESIPNGVALPIHWLQSIPLGLTRRVLRLAVASVTQSAGNIPFQHIETIRALLYKEKGKQFHSRYWQAYRTCDTVCIVTTLAAKPPQEPVAPVMLNGPGTYCFDRYILTVTITKQKPVSLSEQTVVLDEAALSFPLWLRYRQSGDYITLPGGRKKIKKYLIDQKIPASLRGTIPLLCQGNHVLWLSGYVVSTAVAATAQTKTYLVGTISRRTTHA